MKRINVFSIVCILLLSIVTVFASSTSGFCFIDKGDISAQTDPVGLDTSADFSVTTYSSSGGRANCSVYACWSGWPYTCEQSFIVNIGDTYTGTETQSKFSNFYLKIFSMNNNQTSGYGYITVE